MNKGKLHFRRARPAFSPFVPSTSLLVVHLLRKPSGVDAPHPGTPKPLLWWGGVPRSLSLRVEWGTLYRVARSRGSVFALELLAEFSPRCHSADAKITGYHSVTGIGTPGDGL